MNPTNLLSLSLSALLLALSSSCAGAPAQISETAPPVVAGSSSVTVAQHRAGLIKLGALARLPASDSFVAYPGYPGKGFHMGVINDATTFDAVVKTGGWKNLKPIDWHREMAVYLILDAQTNALDFAGYELDGGKATLRVEWSGIEPFYVDSTPAVIAVVPRANTASGVSSIAFVADRSAGNTGGTAIGTIKLP